jgi:hypothetical protein
VNQATLEAIADDPMASAGPSGEPSEAPSSAP